MNQRGAAKAASIAVGLVMLAGLLAVPSMTGAADDGSECLLPEAISIDELLFNPKTNPPRPKGEKALPRPIVAGTYSVTLVSHDDHSKKIDQRQEQWFLELLDAGGQVVYKSDETLDLPDADDFISTTFLGEVVTGTATRLRVTHFGGETSQTKVVETINSIVALCALFTSQPQPVGRIIVEKVTDSAGSPQRFAFLADYEDFELGHGERHDSGLIPTGVHSVRELGLAGWTTTAVCSDGSAPDAVDLQEDETVTCTFTNTESTLDLATTLDDAPRGGLAEEPNLSPGDRFDYVVNVMGVGSADADNVLAVLTLAPEVSADSGALDPACVPAGTRRIVCAIGAVPSGEMGSVRVAVLVRQDSSGVGSVISSVSVAEDGFGEEANKLNNSDVEPTSFESGGAA